MNKTVVRALMDCLRFLDLPGDDVVDPDAAVAVMEGVATVLEDLDASEKDELSAVLSEIEAEERAIGEPEDRVSFLVTFMDDFGLTEEDEADGG